MKTQDELIAQVTKYLAQRRSYDFIKDYLLREGQTFEQIDFILAQAKLNVPPPDPNVARKRRLVWLTCVVLTFVIFMYLVPLSIYNKFPFIFSFIGGAMACFFLAQLVGDFRSWNEFNVKDKKLQDWRHKVAPIMVLPALVLVFVFVMHFNSRERRELMSNGERVTGTITAGSMVKAGRGKTASVTVMFTTKDGKEIIVEESVSEDEFNSIYEGQEIDLVYSKDDPKIIELLLHDDAAKKYTGGEEREIKVNDLLDIVSKSPEEITAALGKIHRNWKRGEDSTWVFENSMIRLYPGKRLVYGEQSTNSLIKFPEQCKAAGLTRQETDNKQQVKFENDKYMVMVEMVIEKQEQFMVSSTYTVVMAKE